VPHTIQYDTIRCDTIYIYIRNNVRALYTYCTRAECSVIYYVHDRPDGCCGGLRQNLIVNARGTTFSQLADVVFRAINHSAERYRRRRFATETPSLPRGNGVHANVTTTDATAGPEFRFSLYYYYYYYYHNGKRGLISRRYYNNNLIVRRHRRRFVAVHIIIIII